MAPLRILLNLPTLGRFSAEPILKRRGGRRSNGFSRKNTCITECSSKRRPFLDPGLEKDSILMRKVERKERFFVLRANNQGSGFNNNGGGGGRGGGGDKGSVNTRALGNLALAVGLTYLSLTGQLGWVLDAIVSIWLLVVLLPIVGLGIFFWYAGRDIVQSSCPNCGNDFQILKSSMNDGVQLCPFCTQPFSVQGNKFVRESTKFSSGRSKMSEQVFNAFSRRLDKGKVSSTAIVDIEAEVKDVE